MVFSLRKRTICKSLSHEITKELFLPYQATTQQLQLDQVFSGRKKPVSVHKPALLPLSVAQGSNRLMCDTQKNKHINTYICSKHICVG